MPGEPVPVVGKNVNIVAVFPNSQNNLPLHCPDINRSQCLSIPYTLTHPGGVEQGVLEYINTTDHYDMVLSFIPTTVGSYLFQTDRSQGLWREYQPTVRYHDEY